MLYKNNLKRPRTLDALIIKINELIEKQSVHECHIWKGSVSSDDVPVISFNSKKVLVKRFLYDLHFSNNESGIYTNKCKNSRCVNISHITFLKHKRTKIISINNINRSYLDLTVFNKDELLTYFYNNIITEPNSGCWIWIKSISNKGYGRAHLRPFEMSSHRFSWILFRGKIPETFHICHKCDTPSCVNPEHLFIGTAADNMADKIKKGRSKYAQRKNQCKHGHEFNENNTYIYFVNNKKHRQCKECRKKYYSHK